MIYNKRIPQFVDTPVYHRRAEIKEVDQPGGGWNGLENYDAQGVIDKQRHRLIFAAPMPQGKDRFGNDLDKRLRVTEESINDAVLAYRLCDPKIKDIVRNYTTAELRSDNTIPDRIRGANELRVELGAYILRELDEITALPDRVQTNGQKRINYVGYDYPNLSSREAVALLALSMLDGTFKKTITYDPVEIDANSRVVICGQHRWAAIKVLGIGENYRENVVGVKLVYLNLNE